MNLKNKIFFKIGYKLAFYILLASVVSSNIAIMAYVPELFFLSDNESYQEHCFYMNLRYDDYLNCKNVIEEFGLD